ncbi:MAG: alpha-amylase family glycosyl hydrolase [Herpetosiphon sp.]
MGARTATSSDTNAVTLAAASASPLVEGPTATAFPLRAGWWDNAVCYEVFVRSFYDSDGDGIGDLPGLTQKLDYINDGNLNSTTSLGANCIWLMPVMESPSYHGYDTTDYYKVARQYGTNEDFKRLVAEAHKRGIKVILDLVLNHTSNQHPWFQEALNDPASPHRRWYIWSESNPGYKGPWGQEVWHKSPVRDEYYYGIFGDTQPDLNYRNPAVTQEADKLSAFWLTEMGADGFRMDAIKHLIEAGQVQEDTPETHAWLRQYRTFLQQTKQDAFTVGEIFDASPVTLAPYYPDQLDSYFAFDIGKALLTAAATGQSRQFVGSVRVVDKNLPFQRYAPFLTNHDQDRAMSVLGNDVAKAKIAATALLTIPGLPFVYYGEEIGMLGQKPDEQIRTPMQWSADQHGGFTAGTPWEPLQANWRTANAALEGSDGASLLNTYRRLIHLRTMHPALASGDFLPLKTSNNAVAAFVRQRGEETLLVVLNFDKEAVQGAAISSDRSSLLPGMYRLQALEPATMNGVTASLSVMDQGTVAAFVPIETLAPKTGYVWKLSK